MKQYLIVRSDLNMRKGKIASQCCHASNKILLMDLLKSPSKWFVRLVWFCIFKKWIFKDPMTEWLNRDFSKIVLRIPKKYKNQDYILDWLVEWAKRGRYYTSIIEDSGKTEFNGIKTKTVCGIGPFDTKCLKNENINKILRGFDLL